MRYNPGGKTRPVNLFLRFLIYSGVPKFYNARICVLDFVTPLSAQHFLFNNQISTTPTQILKKLNFH